MRVFGLDPGSERTGYGCIDGDEDSIVRLASGVLHLGVGDMSQRLVRLHAELTRLFATYRPDVCAVEGIFYHRNARSALRLGQARGVCLLAAAECEVAVVEYAPARVKSAVAGNGAADKSVVGTLVARLLNFEPNDTFDETDALAVALCHLEAGRPLRLIE